MSSTFKREKDFERNVRKLKRTREEIMEIMHPEESKMEVRVRNALFKKTIWNLSNEPFVLESTTPDIFLPDKRIAIYLDGPIHKGREDQDEELRGKLAKRYGVKVLSISYKANTKKEFKSIMQQIEEVIE